MTAIPPRPRIEDRLAVAGLPGLPRTAWLEIDLDALQHNLEVVRGLAGPGVPVRPVVKADAYGHGAVPVALALETAGVDGFCVAAIDEALDLRAGGIRGPIVVLYPVPPAWAAEAALAGIGVTAGDPDGLSTLIREAGRANLVDTPLDVELEVETGLGRGGFAAADVVAAADLVDRSPAVRLAGLWTHFQAVENRPGTAAQLERFEAAVAAIETAGIALPPRHVAASAALMDGIAAYEGVRPGLALYGITPDEIVPGIEGAPEAGSAAGLRPVMALYARPVRVATLPAGWGISYGPTFRTARESRIATLPLGYGDGWARVWSNRATAIVRGQRVPLVGNVAMDAVMADVTDVPGPPVDATDEFVLLGTGGTERITAFELAQQRTTNTWEVVTAMARRLPRVYHAAADPVGLRTLTQWRG